MNKVVRSKDYNNQKVKDEVNNIIDKNGLYNYEVTKIVAAGDAAKLKVVLELYLTEEGNQG